MEHLSKLFGSPARVKLLRLFIFNPDAVYDRDTIVARGRVTPDTASKETASLARAGIIRRRTYYKPAPAGARAPKKRKTVGWVLDPRYPYLVQLGRFLRDTLSLSDADLRGRLREAGAIHLLVLAGRLIDQKEAELDLLIVGNKLDEDCIQGAVRVIEAECGIELRYAVLTTGDFEFRRRVRDKLVRDVLDFPHRVVIDRRAR